MAVAADGAGLAAALVELQELTRRLRQDCPWDREQTLVTLKPYLIDTMGELPARGIKKVLVIAPGFASDCLETLEEIEGENCEHFMHHGGEKFAYVPCLNDSSEGIDVIETVVRRELGGWI